jgi:predicted outer membrane repeat protein
MKKSTFSLLIVLIMILTISAASAADIDDSTDDIISQDAGESSLEVDSAGDVVLQASDDAEILSDGGTVKNFTELKNDIENAPGYALTMKSDYVRADGEKDIVIDKTVVISGGNFKIDANGKGGIFNVTSDGVLVLSGVTLINGKSEYGGAIYNEGKIPIASDCTFANNTATSAGGAIYNLGLIESIDGSTFSENTAENGGAIYTSGSTTITDSNFKDNTATYNGGAIYSTGTVTLTDCVLDSNDVIELETSASQNRGGAAIYANNAIITLINTEVTNNGRDLNRSNGDLINAVLNLLNSETTITGSLFKNNTGIYGGAIYAENGKMTISESNFAANNAYSGAAIQLEGNLQYDIKNTAFTDNNKAVGIGSPGYTAGGGAIFLRGGPEGTMDNITVKGSHASQGGAIDIEKSKATITRSTFEDNVAEGRGGALFIYAPGTTVDNCTFKNNTAAEGGAITHYDNAGGSEATITNVIFDSNKANNGGAILALDNLDISGSTFTDNEATNGGAIFFTKYCTDASLTDSEFSGNTATNEGNAIYNNQGKITLTGNDISKTSVDIYNVGGGAITTVNVTVMDNASVIYGVYEEVLLFATVTDVDGNLINDTGFSFVLTATDATETIAATFDAADNLYKATFNPNSDVLNRNYVVSIANTGATGITYNAKTARLVTVKGTYTDLRNKINNANGQPVELNYSFAYVPEIDVVGDVDQFPTGIEVSDLTINGNGYTISGSNSHRVFNVTAGTLTLNNLTISDGAAIGGAGVLVNSGAKLIATDVIFSENIAEYSGGAIYATGATIELTNCVLDYNDALEKTTNDNTGGAAINAISSTVTIINSNITNNGDPTLDRTKGDVINAVVNLINSNA